MRKSIALMVLFLAACTASPPVPVPSEPTRPAPPPDVSAATCADGLPGEWTDRLRDGVLSVDAEKPMLAASSEDARTVFVTDEATRLLMIRDGRHQEVFSASDGRSVTGVDFDGRWLTFAVRVVNYSWIAYAWDSESDVEPFVVAEHNGPDYAPPPRTFVRRGTAIWLMGGELRLHDLQTRQHQVFARGVRNNPVVFGDMVIWQGEGLQAFSISERRPVDVPEVLPPADPSTNLAADELTVAWVQDDVLRAWRPGWPEARPLVGLMTGTSGMRVEEVSGNLIHWVHTNSHLTDLRTGATYRLTGDSSYTGVALRGGAYGDTYDYKSVVVPVAELPPLSLNC